MTAPFRGSGPWRGRGPFLGRGPWAGKAPFGFNAGLPFQINVTGAQLRDALATPSAWGTTGAATGWLLPGLGGARLSGDCRTSVAMQQKADGSYEYAAHNLLSYSEQFDNAAWTKDANRGSFATNATAPSGALTAQTLTAGSGNFGYAYRTVTTVSGVQYAFSFYAKSGSVEVAYFETCGRPISYVNLTTLAVSAGAGVTVTATNVGAGWVRIVGIAPATAASHPFSLGGAAASGSQAMANGNTILVWGAQLNFGPVALPYVPTGAAARYGPAIDWLSGIGSYGIRSEAARTNLLVRSTEFNDAAWSVKINSSISANATVAPDGTTTGDKLVEDTATGQHWVGNAATGASTVNGTTYTYSVYAKQAERGYIQIYGDAGSGSLGLGAVFNLTNGTVFSFAVGATASITNAGNGWYRCVVTSTATSSASVYPYIGLRQNSAPATDSYTGDGTSGAFIWGAQLEAGTEASSPILTYAAAATRAADTLVVLDSGWINQTEGTLAADWITANAGNCDIFALSDGTANEFISAFKQAANVWAGYVIDGGALQASLTTGTAYTPNTPAKIATAYRVNDFAGSFNAGTVVTDVSGTVPALNRLVLGANATAGAEHLRGHLTRIRYSRRRASNAQLQAMTV